MRRRDQPHREWGNGKRKSQKSKGLCLGKCGKIEKALTGNETLQPIEIKHVALR